MGSVLLADLLSVPGMQDESMLSLTFRTWLRHIKKVKTSVTKLTTVSRSRLSLDCRESIVAAHFSPTPST